MFPAGGYIYSFSIKEDGTFLHAQCSFNKKEIKNFTALHIRPRDYVMFCKNGVLSSHKWLTFFEFCVDKSCSVELDSQLSARLIIYCNFVIACKHSLS